MKSSAKSGKIIRSITIIAISKWSIKIDGKRYFRKRYIRGSCEFIR